MSPDNIQLVREALNKCRNALLDVPVTVGTLNYQESVTRAIVLAECALETIVND